MNCARNPEKKFKVPNVIDNQSNNLCWNLRNLEETLLFGQELILKLPEIKLLLLQGELGAGKTSLVKGIAKGLGIKEPITSPTFALSQHYPLGNPPLIHLDLYRLEKTEFANELFLQEAEEALAIGGLMIVEWPERLSLKLTEAWTGKIEYTKNNERIIQLYPPFFDKKSSTS
tara:strand:+ start:478 stop:996 length:519 start_codon:yes stop_codon:yes gene_type:complete